MSPRAGALPEQMSPEASSDPAGAGGARPLTQPERGYRSNVDALLLAAFAAEAPPSASSAGPPRADGAARSGGPRRARRPPRVWDLGAGVGAVALLHRRVAGQPRARLTLVERDPERAALARLNLAAEGAEGEVLELDVGALPPETHGAADLVLCNPPWFLHGTASPEPARASARSGDPGPFLAASRALLGARGRACWVFPVRSLTSLLVAARNLGLEPKRLRLVHAFRERPARAALVAFAPGRPGGLVVEAPLVEWDAPRVPSAELARWAALTA